ncbi:MAG: MFS transporter [Burkholderiaceae bacterium]
MSLRTSRARALTLRHLRKDLFPWVIALAVGVDYFDNSIFSFFASYIAGGLDTPTDELVWSTSAYAITSVLGIVQQQWLVERVGYRIYLSGCLLMFAIGALIVSICESPIELALARGFQGYFIGPMLGTCRILLQTCFTPQERPPATRRFLTTILSASALGPLVGGYLVANFEWRALFVCSTILGLAFAVLAFLITPHVGKRRPERRTETHLWPYLVLAGAIGALQVVAQQVRFELFSTSPLLMALTISGVVALGWVAWHQWHHPKPLVRLNALREGPFRVGIALYASYYAVSNALGYLVSRLLQSGMGYPVEYMGRLVGFTSMASIPMAFVYFRYSKQVQRKRWLIVPGFLMTALIGIWISLLPPDVNTGWLLPPLLVRGSMLMFIAMPTASVVFQIFADDEFNHGYRLKNIVKQLSYSFSTAQVIIFEQHRLAVHRTRLTEYTSPSNPNFQSAFDALARTFESLGYAADSARTMALEQLNKLVDHQATFMSLQDGFLVITILALISAVLATLQRQIK